MSEFGYIRTAQFMLRQPDLEDWLKPYYKKEIERLSLIIREREGKDALIAFFEVY